MTFLYGLGCLILLGGVGLAVFLGLAGIPSSWTAGATTAGGRAVIAVLGVAALGAALSLFAQLMERLAADRSIRRPGPRGEIAIAPRAVRELAAGLLSRRLGLSGYRISVVPKTEGVYIKVTLGLPPEEEAPRLAERLQELLTQELEAKTGLPVEEVDLVIRGMARPSAEEG
ncbi:MAG: hypothetical protein XD60_0963 [Acetothermia bacterium 64_32]|nr:MAG: hypothetical protein XD60_0963 [Acetothermia bacterium 64_32]HAF70146.1 hypothetical protein [Candidatus Acetothermia bacterium]